MRCRSRYEGQPDDQHPAPNLVPLDSCGIHNWLDYMFVTHDLNNAVTAGGVFRKELWGTRKTNRLTGTLTLRWTDNDHQASDYSAAYLCVCGRVSRAALGCRLR